MTSIAPYTTMEWTSLKLIQWTAGHFEKKGVPNSRLDAELLLAHVLQCKRIDLYTGFEKILSEKHLAAFRSLVERRAKREPLQYILEETEFWGLKIMVTPDVLIPRPETELLVEEALKHSGAKDILDIGTGSGCIAIALAKNFPEAKITATDISKEALAIAQENAVTHKVHDRIEFILSDIAPWKSFEAAEKKFDVIVSNAPYIPTGELDSLQMEVRDFEPRKALDGGIEGLDVIRRIIEEAKPFLKSNGTLLLEIGENQDDVLRQKGFEIRKDYNGIGRLALMLVG